MSDDTDYLVVPASEEQYHVSLENQFVEWGRGLPWDDFVRREKFLKGETAQGRNLQCWVLVPASNPTTLDFYCSCESYRRPIVLSASSSGNTESAPSRLVSYAIASVFTPLRHRRQGHAKRMMSILHSHFRVPPNVTPPLYEEGQGAWKGGKDGVVSFLYSDVGPDFYAACGESGWKVRGAVSTVWDVPASSITQLTVETSNLTPITLGTLAGIAKLDAELLLESHPNFPSKSWYLEPNASPIEWHCRRSHTQIPDVADGNKPGVFGYSSSSLPLDDTDKDSKKAWGFILFCPDYPSKTLKILRFRPSSSPSTTQSLLQAALYQAQKLGMAKVEMYNAPKEVVDWEGEELGQGFERGKTEEREGSLSAVAWYGVGEEPEWVLNERFAWV